MPDKKLTDSEIVKAFTLDEAITHCYEVANKLCNACGDEHLKLAKWLEELKTSQKIINRQEEEIEAWKHYYNECLIDLKNAHAEIEKIKKDLRYYLDTNEENGVVYVPKFIVEKILNELVGDGDAKMLRML